MLKIHDFLRLSDINFGQCISQETRLQTKKTRLLSKHTDSRGRGPLQCLVEFTTSRLIIKVKSAKLAKKKNTTAVDSLIYTETQQEDRFLRGRQIAFMIYDYFQVTGAHDTVLEKPGTTPWTTEFLAYHFRPSNSRIQLVRTWSRR